MIALALLLGCAPTEPPGPPDVLLITVDALNVERTALGSYWRKTTPNLGALAGGAVLFERTYVHDPRADHALAHLMRGSADDATGNSLAEVFDLAGYRTEGHVGRALDPAVPTEGFDALLVGARPADAVTDGAIAAWQAAEGRRFFWVHLADPEPPWTAHPEHDFGDVGTDAYDSELAMVDAQLGRLVEAVGEQTAVFVTASGSLPLDATRGAAHSTPYDADVRVPFVLRVPRVQGSQRLVRAVGQADIAPTIAVAADLHPATSWKGHPLNPSPFGKVDAASLGPQPIRGPGWCAVVLGRHKWIRRADGTEELYDLRVDGAERSNLIADPRQAEALAELRGVGLCP